MTTIVCGAFSLSLVGAILWLKAWHLRAKVRATLETRVQLSKLAALFDLRETINLNKILNSWKSPKAGANGAETAEHRRVQAKATKSATAHASLAARVRLTLLAASIACLASAYTVIYSAR